MNDYPQIVTQITENGVALSTVIDAPWVSVTSINGMTGDVLVEPVVIDFIPGRFYKKNTLVLYGDDLYRAKSDFDAGSSFDENDWERIAPNGSTDWDSITNKPAGLVIDNNYTHTDNNYSTTEKNALSHIKDTYSSLVPDIRIPANSDLNNLSYLKVGRYYVATYADAQTIAHMPISGALMLETYSPLYNGYNDETTRAWVYRLQRAITAQGRVFMRPIYSQNTPGVFTYGDWEELAQADNVLQSLDIGTVQSGSTAAASITGTAPTQHLNLTLPKGDKGDAGEDGRDGKDADPPEAVKTVSGSDITILDTSYLKSLNKIIGNTEQEIVRGKNLACPYYKGVSSNGVTSSYNDQTGEITISGTTTASGWATPLMGITGNFQAGKYVLKQYSALTNARIGVNFKDVNNVTLVDTLVDTSTLETTVTIPRDAYKMYIWVGGFTSGQTVSGSTRVQLEYGEVATSFEKYIEPEPNSLNTQPIQVATSTQTISVDNGDGDSEQYTLTLGNIELCKIGEYQDYIYKSGNKWYIHKETAKVNLGDLTWDAMTTALSGKNRFRATDFVGLPAMATAYDTKSPIVCSHFIANSSGATYDRTQAIAANTVAGQAVVYSEELSGYTAAQFKSWASTNNVVAYYGITTPTDTEITSFSLITQLEMLENMTLYQGETNIAVSATDSNSPVMLDLDYWTWFKGEKSDTGDYILNTEIDTGNYFLGKKIYKYTLLHQSITQGNSYITLTDKIANFGLIARPIEGVAIDQTNNTQIGLPYTSSSNVANNVGVWVDDQKRLVVASGTNRSDYHAYITLYYTKDEES